MIANVKQLSEALTEYLGDTVSEEYLDLFTEPQQKYLIVLIRDFKNEPKVREILESRRGEKIHRVNNKII